MEKPVLSICIPTYNRADYLIGCLDAIVNQEGFDERVEVVISDNCSTDNTKEICHKYLERYKNIHYFCNEENVRALNFSLAFQRATGMLRKLSNDTVMYKPGAIKKILDFVTNNSYGHPQLYFLNSGKLDKKVRKASSLEEYFDILGHNITWIGSLAIWEEDCPDLHIFMENADTKLGQVPFLINNFLKHGSSIIFDEPVMDFITPAKKDISYGLYKVFYCTLLGFIRPYCETSNISKRCYENIRKRLLLEFFVEWIVNYKIHNKRYIFSDERLKELVESEYKNETYFSKYRRKYCLYYVKAIISRILGRI